MTCKKGTRLQSGSQKWLWDASKDVFCSSMIANRTVQKEALNRPWFGAQNSNQYTVATFSLSPWSLLSSTINMNGNSWHMQPHLLHTFCKNILHCRETLYWPDVQMVGSYKGQVTLSNKLSKLYLRCSNTKATCLLGSTVPSFQPED